MNSFDGHIVKIEVCDDLSLVSVWVSEEINLHTIVVETPDTADYLRMDNPVKVLFKETEVILGKGNNIPVSLQNRIPGTVKRIEKGTLISRVVVRTQVGEITSIISTRGIDRLRLTENDSVVALIKLNEIMLSKQ